MGPVVVGGVGGSGTRVVAEILLAAGVDLGNDLSRELDDLWFNLLFYRPAWLEDVLADDRARAALPGLSLMHKRAHGMLQLTSAEWTFVRSACRDAFASGYFSGRRVARTRRLRSAWVARRVARFLRAGLVRRNHRAWGWKEPISHLLAPAVLRTFGGARYVHVIRHGLDMAFSGNRRQVRRFAPLLGLHTGAGLPQPTDILRFWVQANRRVLDVVVPLAPSQVHVIKFEDLCSRPAIELDHLLTFLGISVGPAQFARLCAVPRTPDSSGRFRTQDLAVFPRSDLDEVERLGFRI